MDLERVLAELRKERDAIDAAILSLERLEHVGTQAAHSSELSARKPTKGSNGAYRTQGQGESS